MPWSLSYVGIDAVYTSTWCPNTTQDLRLRLSRYGEPTTIKIWNIKETIISCTRMSTIRAYAIAIREVIEPVIQKVYTLSACVLSYSNLNVVKLITVGFGDGGVISLDESNYTPGYHMRLSKTAVTKCMFCSLWWWCFQIGFCIYCSFSIFF